ncbi:GEM-like protein 7 isoform X2 [Populus nigra]|uniref:GEM-like protein 7 isoform X2 n=1 Tax=Populus nigra TaxID=3691 RepID=UPI002B277CC1|nr:GEM-like protein 7 isoform X2 [Populus nigra]
MSQRKIPPPHYEQTGTPSSFYHPGAGTPSSCNHPGAAGGSSNTIANYFDRVISAGLLDTMKFEAKKIKKGGRRNIFKQKFDVRAGEKLLKASHCFFSIETGAVAGLLFISTEKIAFCSQRSIAFNFPILQKNQTVEQIIKQLNCMNLHGWSCTQKKPDSLKIDIFMSSLRYH